MCSAPRCQLPPRTASHVAGGWAIISDDVASIRDSAQQMSQKPANATDQFQTVNYDSDLTVQHPHGTASIETRRSNLSGQRQGAPEMETRRSNLSGQRPGALEDGTAASRGGGDDGGPRWGWRFPDPSVCEDITPPACDVATQHPHDNASLGMASGCPPITTQHDVAGGKGSGDDGAPGRGVRTQLRGLLLRRLSRRPRRRGPPRSRHVRPFTTNSLWLQQS